MKMKNILLHIMAGLAIGSVVSTVCISLMDGINGTLIQIFAWLFASALYGAVSLIYDTDFWPLPVQIAEHFILCFVITLITAWKLGYADSLGILALQILPSFLIIYIAVSVILFAADHHSAKQINQKLQ